MGGHDLAADIGGGQRIGGGPPYVDSHFYLCGIKKFVARCGGKKRGWFSGGVRMGGGCSLYHRQGVNGKRMVVPTRKKREGGGGKAYQCTSGQMHGFKKTS